MCPTREDHEDDVLISTRKKVKRPRRYAVVLHNDDYTTQEFVVEVLMRFFQKDRITATKLMLDVHMKGHGIAGAYPYDVAESKIGKVTRVARATGHPLLLTMEPE